MSKREPTLYDILDPTGTEVILPMVSIRDARFILGDDFDGTKRRLSNADPRTDGHPRRGEIFTNRREDPAVAEAITANLR